jgi:hypothetical protein
MIRNDVPPIDASIKKVNAMSVEELEHQLPLAQNALEAIEVELEALMAQRDCQVIRVAAMRKTSQPETTKSP